MIASRESNCRPVSSSVPKGVMLDLLLINIFISDINEGLLSNIGEHAEDTKLKGIADEPAC